MLSGIVLMGAAFGLTAYNLYEDAHAGELSSSVLQQLDAERKIYIESLTKPNLPTGITGEIEEESNISPDTPMPTVTIDGTPYIGSIVIPALGLELPVAQDWDYVQMKISPCRYTGSAYKDDFIICGHNYSTHFQNIGDLQKGDTVIFVDAVGNEFYYSVDLVEVLQPSEVERMVSTDYDLSFFSCNFERSARVTVRCFRQEE